MPYSMSSTTSTHIMSVPHICHTFSVYFLPDLPNQNHFCDPMDWHTDSSLISNGYGWMSFHFVPVNICTHIGWLDMCLHFLPSELQVLLMATNIIMFSCKIQLLFGPWFYQCNYFIWTIFRKCMGFHWRNSSNLELCYIVPKKSTQGIVRKPCISCIFLFVL